MGYKFSCALLFISITVHEETEYHIGKPKDCKYIERNEKRTEHSNQLGNWITAAAQGYQEKTNKLN